MTFAIGERAQLPAEWKSTPDSLADRVILIAGATGALGSASALAAAAAGARVILLGRNVRALEKIYDQIEVAHPGRAAIYPLDLSGASPQDYADLCATLELEYQRLDGIVFAAAHFDGLKPAAEIKPEAWLRAMQVNLNAPFLLTQACSSLLRGGAKSASIVFVIDDPARIGKAYWGCYGVSKAGLLGLVSVLHNEWEASPLRVHALLPKPMRSALRRTAYFGENTMALPTADESAAAVIYLLSEEGAAARGKVLDLR
jgi:NAD(P)-dependent dehydrogenase (short-subunit alcohol dehydrogenase family)